MVSIDKCTCILFIVTYRSVPMRKNHTFKATYQVGEVTKEIMVQAMNITSAEKKANKEAAKSFGVSAQFSFIEKI